jgi:predicted regulator of Ras-like GTPase activity (Roadblock/LC7/MglB family)
MAKKSKVEELTDLLKDLEATTPDIEASAVVSVDGLMIASALPRDVEEDRVAAMSAAMLSLGERTATELARGELSEVYVKGENGYVLLMAAGENAVLTALARKDAKLGLVFLDMKRTAGDVARLV